MQTIIIQPLTNGVVPAFADPADVREWGKANGYLTTHKRGRLPQACINDYLSTVLGLTVVEVE